MSNQFHKVDTRFGAPMGRQDWHAEPKAKIRLFRVNLDGGGYDDGGAYWGRGEPLWCATDDMNYRQFRRASDRRTACHKLGIDPGQLRKPLQ